jgi:16S rRNA (guanine527-N7)-methyltransferase
MGDAVLQRLNDYTKLLLDRAVPLGIIGSSDVGRLRERHVDDSLRALRCLGSMRRVADLGSGAGLPGIPVAIAEPDVDMSLIEPRRARAAFLELCVDALELPNVRVLPRRAEEVSLQVDVCLARAVADAGTCWAMAGHLLTRTGRLVYFAGATWSVGDEEAVRAAGVRVERCARPSFPWQGPLVTMARDLPAVAVEAEANR